ncbi:RGCVC family protein [Blastococcus sp. CCUG 61487]|uniref:RGCVC family protein n=1 Tax=Blastococcus sp. CCUG 61487 TaxID=1840703 RepID=UPI00201E36BB|nr:RGCVC family protein [Blastococcus sp. CCUG 61487]
MPTPAATAERPAARTTPVVSAPGCDACPHPVTDHDAVSARYCRATVASGLERGCICQV